MTVERTLRRHAGEEQKALDHASIVTTMRHYAAVLDDDVRAAKATLQRDENLSPALRKLRAGPNLKVVG